jgi:putative ABC transport system ATP-binding protein
MIELKHITKIFNRSRPDEFTALADEPAGRGAQGHGVQGPSGSGKTTLLSIIGCMARPTAGRVSVEGRGDEPAGAVPTEIRRRPSGPSSSSSTSCAGSAHLKT